MSELGKIQQAFRESLDVRVGIMHMSKEQAIGDLRLLLESCVGDAMEAAVDPHADTEQFAELARASAQLALFTSWCQSEGL